VFRKWLVGTLEVLRRLRLWIFFIISAFPHKSFYATGRCILNDETRKHHVTATGRNVLALKRAADKKYFLSEDAVLKWLESPSVYLVRADELFELDAEAFEFLKDCASPDGGASKDDEFIEQCLEEGILAETPAHRKFPPLMKSDEPSLRYLELQITDRCNLRCRHCYIGEGNGDELSPGRIRNILQEFEAMQGLRLLVTGGEPLLHSRFAEINGMLPEFSVRKALFSNGLLLDRCLLEGLNVDEVQVSIDGLESSHDALRGRGSFRRAVRAVELAAEADLDVSVSTMIHSQNLKDFDEMQSLFMSLGVRDWTVDVPCVSGRLAENAGFRVTPEQGGRYLAYGYGGGIHGGAQGFACGLHLMSVAAGGAAAKCTFYSDRPVGSIDEGLRKCWKKVKPLMLADLKCDCDRTVECRGGCRYRAEVLGDPLGKDLYRCYRYDIMDRD
jgi:radical SAM protein with 4Fe4S-binding SPASM domain